MGPSEHRRPKAHKAWVSLRLGNHLNQLNSRYWTAVQRTPAQLLGPFRQVTHTGQLQLVTLAQVGGLGAPGEQKALLVKAGRGHPF